METGHDENQTRRPARSSLRRMYLIGLVFLVLPAIGYSCYLSWTTPPSRPGTHNPIQASWVYPSFCMALFVLGLMLYAALCYAKVNSSYEMLYVGSLLSLTFLVPAVLISEPAQFIRTPLRSLVGIGVMSGVSGVAAGLVRHVTSVIVAIVFGIPKRPLGCACRGCGYDLRGNVSMVCPECGRAVTVGELRETAE